MITDILFGFGWNDPLTYFGDLSIMVLISSFIAIIGFLAAGFYVREYFKNFFGVTEAPKGWLYFFYGLVLSSLYQLLKVPYTYEWIYGDIFIILFLIFQVVAIGVLAYGLYLMNKEIDI